VKDVYDDSGYVTRTLEKLVWSGSVRSILRSGSVKRRRWVVGRQETLGDSGRTLQVAKIENLYPRRSEGKGQDGPSDP